MDNPILFNADNRLLQSATGDLGMYGAQSDAGFSAHEANEDEASDAAPARVADVATGAEPGLISTQVATDAPRSEAGANVATQPGSAPPIAHFSLTAPVAPEFAPAQPNGSPEPAGLILSGVAPIPHAAGAPVSALDPPDKPLTEPDAADSHLEAPMMGTAVSLIDSLVDGPAPATGMADAPFVPAAAGVLTTTVGLVDDQLEGLSGSDPLGGVETLVSMVANSDTFDLAAVVAPVGDAVLGLSETLANTELPLAPLLGDHHDEGGLLGLDHHDDLFGL